MDDKTKKIMTTFAAATAAAASLVVANPASAAETHAQAFTTPTIEVGSLNLARVDALSVDALKAAIRSVLRDKADDANGAVAHKNHNSHTNEADKQGGGTILAPTAPVELV